MKKILSLLTAVSLTAISSVLPISCGNKNNSDLNPKEKNDLNLSDIKNFIEKTQEIKNLANLEEVNKKLKQLALGIEGVTSLTANYYKITTSVIIKVVVEDDNYNLVGGSTFVILNACKKVNIFIEDVKINAKKNILNLKNLEEVNKKLQILLEKINNIYGINLINFLKAKLKENSNTDVIVTVTVNEKNAYLIGGNTFEIVGAIKILPKFFQPTIYIDENGNEISTNAKSISDIKTDEIKQIGFYTVTHPLSDDEVIAVQMPATVKKVPNELPKEITNLNYMFYATTLFNQDISNWDTSNVTNMQGMFQQTRLFNQDISKWDTSKVVDMSNMFNIAFSFNGNISTWDTSNVTNMSAMFSSATNFNKDISNWNTSNLTNMSDMFENATNFNQDISKWDTSKVVDMGSMFHKAINFNQDISKWDTSKVVYMHMMFENAISFNQDISKWDVSKVVYMHMMFENAISFNQDISTWKVINVKYHRQFDTSSNINWTADKKPKFI